MSVNTKAGELGVCGDGSSVLGGELWGIRLPSAEFEELQAARLKGMMVNAMLHNEVLKAEFMMVF